MADPLLSVVIPVYNGTRYLPPLIESLLAQGSVPDEVIFVDDGSTDGSSAMISRLGAGLAGLRIVAQENQGQAVARNFGMGHARGRYLAFLDADDIVGADMYATLFGLAENEQLDIAMANAWNFNEGRKPDTLVFSDVPDTGVITGETWLQQRSLAKNLKHYCWMSVYRRSFIDKHRFTFPLADPHEDVVWVTETLLAAKRLRYVPAPLHKYRKKQVPPLPPAPRGIFRRHKPIEASLYNARALCEIANREVLQPRTRELIRRDAVNSGCNVVRLICRLAEPAQRAHYLRSVNEQRFFRVLWRNATGVSQRWRVLRYNLLACLRTIQTHFNSFAASRR